ncbi:MAG TPA: hypothetical protein VF228_12895 [Iamia sp.]
MTNTTTINRLRLTVGDCTLEIEGDDAFFERHATTLETMVARLDRAPSAPSGRQGGGGGATSGRGGLAGTGDGATGTVEFGEQLGGLAATATATDQMLLAGLAAQRASGENTFSTGDANQLLIEQSVKVGNPSQCMTNNLKAKRVFKVGNRYRVSRAGEEHLASLLSG